MAKFELTDDGTLDTVVRCEECGEEVRFNWSEGPSTSDDDDDRCEHGRRSDDGCADCYDAFVEQCCIDAAEDHECSHEDDEPQGDDITTNDHRHFYSSGRLIVTVEEDADWMPAVGAWCKASGYFPNVWFISDHGNSVLISVSDDGRYLNGYSE